MTNERPERGEMSQDSAPPALHRSVMKPGEKAAPTDAPVSFGITAARRERYSYNTMSASSLGMELGISVVLGLLGGYYLDRYLGTSPWFLLVFLVLGTFAGFRGVVRAMKRADRAAAAEAVDG